MKENRYEEIYHTIDPHLVCSYIFGFNDLSEDGKMRVVDFVFKRCVRRWFGLHERPLIQSFYTSWNVQRKPLLVEKTHKCEKCGGDGFVVVGATDTSFSKEKQCNVCHGNGFIKR